jgi:lipopolysaccharide export system permease protein
MLFTKAFRRELASTAGLVFSTLLTIMVTTTLIRMLGRAANGKVDTASVLPILAFSAINSLSVLLPLALFIAVLSTLTRLYRDSEMVIWMASGQSLLNWIKPVFRFALPFIVVVAGISFFAAPWANRQMSEYKQRFEQREDISQVAAGQFRESAKSSRVFFVEALAEDFSSVKNVFVLQRKGDSQTILVSKSGRIEDNGTDRFLLLDKGRRYDQMPGSPELRVLTFDTHGIRMESKGFAYSDETPKNQSTAALLTQTDLRSRGELLWRIANPLSAGLLCLLAIPLAFVNPRVGRAFNIIAAILIYFLYLNLINLSQSQVSSGKLSFAVGVWLIHAVVVSLILILFTKRMSHGGLAGLLRLDRLRARSVLNTKPAT